MDRKESAKTNRRPLRRKLIRVAVAVAAVVFALLLTGCPQEMLIERVIENALGASVEVEWGGFLGDLRIDALRVYGRPGDMENDSPFLTASGIRVDYRLGGKGGISVPSVVIDELAVYADGSDPDDENFAFIVALLEAEPGEEDPAYWIVECPRRFSRRRRLRERFARPGRNRIVRVDDDYTRGRFALGVMVGGFARI